VPTLLVDPPALKVYWIPTWGDVAVVEIVGLETSSAAAVFSTASTRDPIRMYSFDALVFVPLLTVRVGVVERGWKTWAVSAPLTVKRFAPFVAPLGVVTVNTVVAGVLPDNVKVG
jgi:hypothetical protein